MPHSPKHKQETRERIVNSARRLFNRKGFNEVTIDEIMKHAGLTRGGFYKHFGSKDELLAEAIAKAFEEVEDRFDAAVSKAKPGTELLKSLIENYLSLEHCANPGEGCPMAAMASEIGRFPKAARAEIEKAMRRRVKRAARLLPGKTERERERNCIALMSGLVGTLNVARALSDPAARKAVLDASRDFYIKSFCN